MMSRCWHTCDNQGAWMQGGSALGQRVWYLLTNEEDTFNAPCEKKALAALVLGVCMNSAACIHSEFPHFITV